MAEPRGRVQLLFRHTHTTDDDEQRLTLGSDPRASMAMSDTGSSFAQWAALYHHHDPAVLPDEAATDVVGVGIGIGTTAAAAAVASPTSGGSSGGGSPTKAGAQQQQLHGVEGPRIGKPAGARRRSRASRRAPVTLLNTDTANFRAMVQQFTGIPAPPAGAFGVGAPVINFAADYGFPPASASAVMSFDHHQQLHRSHSHPAPAPLQEQLRRQQQYTGGASSPFGYNGGGLLQGGGGAGGDVFASHGGFAASAEDRMLLQSIQQAAQMPHMPPVSAANTSTNGFFA